MNSLLSIIVMNPGGVNVWTECERSGGDTSVRFPQEKMGSGPCVPLNSRLFRNPGAWVQVHGTFDFTAGM